MGFNSGFKGLMFSNLLIGATKFYRMESKFGTFHTNLIRSCLQSRCLYTKTSVQVMSIACEVPCRRWQKPRIAFIQFRFLFSCIDTSLWKGAPEVGRLQLKCDGTRWRTGGEVKGKLANGVGTASTLHTTSERGVSSITTAEAHTSAASSRLNWRPHQFKWTRSFRRKMKSGFCARAITFQTQSNLWHGTLIVMT